MTGSHEVDGSIPFSSTTPSAFAAESLGSRGFSPRAALPACRGLRARRLLACVMGAAVVFSASAAGAFPNSKARVFFDLTHPDLTASCGDLDANTLSPGELTLHGIGGPWLLWVLVSDTKGLAGVSFGIDADPGVKILSWQSCGDFQFPAAPWPQPGGANTVIWNDCVAPESEIVSVGFFLLDVGSVGTIRILPHTQFNEIQLVDCNMHLDVVPESSAAAAAVWPDSASYRQVGLVWRVPQERPEPTEPDSVVLAREAAARREFERERHEKLEAGAPASSAARAAADTLRVPENKR